MTRGPLGLFRELVERLVPGGGLRERTIKSGIWVMLRNVADRGMQLVMLVVLARLLDPEDFGLLGIALLSIAVLRRLSKLGLDTALIQNEDENVDAYMNTVWLIQIVRGVVICVVGFVSAPYVASFFDAPMVADVLRVLAFSPLLRSFRNPYIVYLKKDLDLHVEFVHRISATFGKVVVGIALAVILGNVWALVAANLVGNALLAALSYPLARSRPSLGFDRALAVDLFQYGKWMTGASIFGFLFSQGDDAFLGWFLGATALGYYQLSYQIARAPATEITSVISTTMLSSYSKMQGDRRSLRQAYFKAIAVSTTVSAPMAVGIAVVASDFVVVFLGEEWLPTVALMQVLAAWGYLLSIGSPSGPLLQAIGRPDYTAKATFMKTVLLAVLIYPFTAAYGVVGTAVAVVASAALTSEPYVVWNVLREIDGSVRELAWQVGVPTAAALVMGASVMAAKYAFLGTPSLLGFVALVLVGVTSYVLTLLLFDRVFGFGISDLFVQLARVGVGSSTA